MYFSLRLVISIWNANPTWPTSAADPFLPNKATKIMLVEKAPSVLQRTSYSIPEIIISWNLYTFRRKTPPPSVVEREGVVHTLPQTLLGFGFVLVVLLIPLSFDCGYTATLRSLIQYQGLLSERF